MELMLFYEQSDFEQQQSDNFSELQFK